MQHRSHNKKASKKSAIKHLFFKSIDRACERNCIKMHRGVRWWGRLGTPESWWAPRELMINARPPRPLPPLFLSRRGKSASVVVAAAAALHVIFSHSESQKPNECLCRARPGVAQQRDANDAEMRGAGAPAALNSIKESRWGYSRLFSLAAGSSSRRPRKAPTENSNFPTHERSKAQYQRERSMNAPRPQKICAAIHLAAAAPAHYASAQLLALFCGQSHIGKPFDWQSQSFFHTELKFGADFYFFFLVVNLNVLEELNRFFRCN